MKLPAIQTLVFLIALACSGAGTEPALKAISVEAPLGRDAVPGLAEEIRAENPDVVLIQGARSWGVCSALTEALTPEPYVLLTCSGFGAATSGRLSREVAVIARQKGFYAWTERIGTNFPAVGFAVTVVRSGAQTLALFSAQFGRATQAVEVAESIVRHVELLRAWEKNKPTAFLVMSSGRTPNLRTQKEVRDVFSNTGLEKPLSAPPDRFVFAYPSETVAWLDSETTNRSLLTVTFKPAKTPEAAKLVESGRNLDRKPVVVEPVSSVVSNQLPSAAPETPRSTNGASRAAVPSAPAIADRDQTVAREAREAVVGRDQSGRVLPLAWLALAGLTASVAACWLWLSRRGASRKAFRRPVLISERSELDSMQYVVVAPASATGSGDSPPPSRFKARVISQHGQETIRTQSASALEPARLEPLGDADQTRKGLVEWLKAEFVRRIVRDRLELMDSQSAAVSQANEGALRLARIEERIRVQNESFARRIADLETELGAAREENREMIRLRIWQIKADMEAARARLLSQSDA